MSTTKLHDYIYNIEISEIQAELNVMEQMSNTYTKAANILEYYNGNDLSSFKIFNDDYSSNNIIQEGKIMDDVKKQGEGKSVLNKIVWFIPRLIMSLIKYLKGELQENDQIKQFSKSIQRQQQIDKKIPKKQKAALLSKIGVPILITGTAYGTIIFHEQKAYKIKEEIFNKTRDYNINFDKTNILNRIKGDVVSKENFDKLCAAYGVLKTAYEDETNVNSNNKKEIDRLQTALNETYNEKVEYINKFNDQKHQADLYKLRYDIEHDKILKLKEDEIKKENEERERRKKRNAELKGKTYNLVWFDYKENKFGTGYDLTRFNESIEKTLEQLNDIISLMKFVCDNEKSSDDKIEKLKSFVNSHNDTKSLEKVSYDKKSDKEKIFHDFDSISKFYNGTINTLIRNYETSLKNFESNINGFVDAMDNDKNIETKLKEKVLRIFKNYQTSIQEKNITTINTIVEVMSTLTDEFNAIIKTEEGQIKKSDITNIDSETTSNLLNNKTFTDKYDSLKFENAYNTIISTYNEYNKMFNKDKINEKINEKLIKQYLAELIFDDQIRNTTTGALSIYPQINGGNNMFNYLSEYMYTINTKMQILSNEKYQTNDQSDIKSLKTVLDHFKSILDKFKEVISKVMDENGISKTNFDKQVKQFCAANLSNEQKKKLEGQSYYTSEKYDYYDLAASIRNVCSYIVNDKGPCMSREYNKACEYLAKIKKNNNIENK